MALARFLSLFSRAQASAQRIEEFLDTKPTVYDSEDLIVVDELKPAIKVENLSFSYPDEPEEIVLDNISFEIKAGRSEERRVGKECRSRWWRYNYKRKE